MVKVGDPIGPLANAQALAALGLQVFPARYAHKLKAPIVKWKPFLDQPVTERHITRWFTGSQPKNFWILCGRPSGVVVLDTDSEQGDVWWRSQPGMADLMDRTAAVRTSKGYHYWFKIPDGWAKPIQGWAVHPETHATDDLSWDFRADGGGVLAPPSVHESGHRYVWVRPFTAMLDAPEELLTGGHRELAPETRAKEGSATPSTTARQGGGVSSMLSSLLKNPPAEGGRNDWLARVAGHYAKSYRNQWDLYELHCQQANALASPPLDDAEFEKTIRSLWDKEIGRPDEELKGLLTFNGDSGWLHGSGRKLFTQVRHTTKDPDTGEITTEYDREEWSDFDIKCLGVIVGGEGETNDYWCILMRSSTTETLETVLPGTILGDTGKLSSWLASKRCTIMPPDNMFPKTGTYGVRLQRYLESQDPPKTHVTNQLGWAPSILQGQGGFVTLDEIITMNKRLSFTDAGIRPDPRMRIQAAASHHYGFRHTKKEARAVLREVLTYQEENITSVFGAWWAACLLKPQLQGSGMFPFMAIEAPSESGKTSGFFNMMVQMNGSTKGQSIQTGPATRNAIAAHNNGIVWIDDMDDPARIMELLRTATANGTIAKQGGADFGATMEFRLVAPVLLSGEALGVSLQKATADRAIQLEVSSPTKRRSLKDPTRPQWDDIQELQARYPEEEGQHAGLSALAGWYVQLALGQAQQARAALAAASTGDGRSSQKHAVLLTGARLLDALVANNPQDVALAWGTGGEHFRRVSAWVTGEQAVYNPLDNSLTQDVLPWALRHYGFPVQPEWRPDGGSDPVWVEGAEPKPGQLITAGEATIWFHPGNLAAAWARNKRTTLERVHTEEALRKQAETVKTGKGKRKRYTGDNQSALYYFQLSGEMAAVVLRRARG